MKKLFAACILLLMITHALAQNYIVLKPDRVFDGRGMHTGWWVLVKGKRIEAAKPGKEMVIPAGTTTIELKGQTLLPGLIEGHSHFIFAPLQRNLMERPGANRKPRRTYCTRR
jgi:imidazolonepropionase-like amidohydrolase